LRVLDDLQAGFLPLYERELSAEEAWEKMYKDEPEFVSVTFNMFKERLKDHCKQVIKLQKRAAFELEAFLHDRTLHPRSEQDRNGNKLFDVSETKYLLRMDIEDGKHLTMTPSQLQYTREEYMAYPLKKFKEKIYQAVKREKYINYLNDKHAKERVTEF
jgi:hypothetical protein